MKPKANPNLEFTSLNQEEVISQLRKQKGLTIVELDRSEPKVSSLWKGHYYVSSRWRSEAWSRFQGRIRPPPASAPVSCCGGGNQQLIAMSRRARSWQKISKNKRRVVRFVKSSTLKMTTIAKLMDRFCKSLMQITALRCYRNLRSNMLWIILMMFLVLWLRIHSSTADYAR